MKSQSNISDAASGHMEYGEDSWVLMYHGISDRAQMSGVVNYWRYNVDKDELEGHLAYLREYCNPISLAEMRTAGGTMKGRPNVIVTFDDGYENNYTLAFPLLKRYRIPAVFALPTAFICESEPLWNDKIEYAVNHSLRNDVRFHWARASYEFSISDLASRVTMYKWLMDECTRMRQERRGDFLEIVTDALGVAAQGPNLFQNADYRPLTARQIVEMSESGLIEYASHSVHHYLLTRLRPDSRRRELRDSKDQIEKITGIPCTTFSVPGGAYNHTVLKDIMAAGYEEVLTSDPGCIAPKSRTLSRNVVRQGDDLQILAEMIGASNT